jgi:hypothetical protein
MLLMTQRFERLLPLSGLAAGGLLAVGLYLSSSEPGDSATAASIVGFWSAHQGYGTYSLFALQWMTFLLICFGAAIRATLRSGEPAEASYSTVAFGGAIVAAVSSGATGLMAAAASHAAERGNAGAAVTINQLYSYDWVPWTAGFAALTLAAGLGGLRMLALPRWLSWFSIAEGIILISPVGIIAFLALPIWLIATALTITLSARSQPRPASFSTAAMAHLNEQL